MGTDSIASSSFAIRVQYMWSKFEETVYTTLDKYLQWENGLQNELPGFGRLKFKIFIILFLAWPTFWRLIEGPFSDIFR